LKVELRYFASLREALGTGAESLELPADVRNIGELRHFLQARGGVWQEVLNDQRAVRAAQNHVVCDQACQLQANAEIAFFPPVTGG
jgi:molybdopterin synthase sulfur carrier subunit